MRRSVRQGVGRHISEIDLAILALIIRRDYPQYGDMFATEAVPA